MHGWTLITPLGWGMPFLSSLIFTGTRVGGLREVKSQTIECGLPYFPDDFSGTTLGQESQEKIGQEAKEKWDRTPPAKRPSYDVLGTRSPFKPDWEVVCGIRCVVTPEDGFEATQRMDVDDTKLWLLYGLDTKTIVAELMSSENAAETLLRHINSAREDRGLPSLSTQAAQLYRGSLVLVKISMCNQGTPTDMSPIYDVFPDEYSAIDTKQGIKVCLNLCRLSWLLSLLI
jgi:ribonuclease P/MRP protein subunit POP1